MERERVLGGTLSPDRCMYRAPGGTSEAQYSLEQ